MELNELMNQLRSNPQAAAQFIQLMQQNGILPPNIGQPNWNIPTNPMSMVWWNNLVNLLNNMNNQNNLQPAQNQNQPQQAGTQPQPQQTDNKVSSVRVVKSPNEIKADEILMNGDISLFLQDDLNVVYGKRWTSDGTVDNMRFIREEDTAQNVVETQNSSEVMTSINLNIEELVGRVSSMVEGKLDQFVKDYSLERRGTPKTNNKKGVEENG